MPTIYASGTPDQNGYYPGLTCSSVAELFSHIETTLTNAGWTITESTPTSLVAVGNDNGDNCYIKMELIESNSASSLHLTGDLDGTGTSVSDGTVVKLPFSPSSQTSLYMTADEAGGCIFIKNGFGDSGSAHFGYPERLTDNPGSWYVGLLTVNLYDAFIAQDIYGVEWGDMGRYFYQNNQLNYRTGAHQNVWDAYTVAHQNYSSFTSYSTSNNGQQNPAFKAWLGAVDSVTNLPILSDYGYLVGKNDNRNDYIPPNYGQGGESAVPLHFPGRIRFARTGLASIETGAQFTSGTQTVISGGPKGVYQGFVIAA